MINDIVVVGDIHGKWPMLNNVCYKYANKTVLGLGDVGIGFPGSKERLPENFKFFRGNHDNPSVCRSHPQYTVEHGMWNGLFILAGANSVDQKWRTPHVDWWPDEQLSTDELEKALDAYKKEKPDILVCHEAPFAIHNLHKEACIIHNRDNERWGEPKGNATAFMLDRMIQSHMPKLVIHGHWHNPLIYKQWGCVFISLGELEVLDLEDAIKYYNIKLKN
jgi:predicted phosphodiesterase